MPDLDGYLQLRVDLLDPRRKKTSNSEASDRRAVELVIRAAADMLIEMALYTPADSDLDWERVIQEFRGTTLPFIREYRLRIKQRQVGNRTPSQ